MAEKKGKKDAKKSPKINKKTSKNEESDEKNIKKAEKEEKRNKSPVESKKTTKKAKYDEALYTKIKEDLLSQLELKGLILEHYINLVDDYMNLWITKELLFQDIKKRGVVVKYDNGGGQKGTKRNESLTDITKISTQMLKILKDLALTPIEEKNKNLGSDLNEVYY